MEFVTPTSVINNEPVVSSLTDEEIISKHLSSLKITTMTLIFNLDCKINLNKIFFLMPITKIPYEITSKARIRYKIPHYDKPGSILSMRYRGMTRGIIRSNSSTHFKNSITLDLSLKEKNVNIKLCNSKTRTSGSKMQMCGAKSLDQGMEGANEILRKIEKIQTILNRVESNPELKKRCIDYIHQSVVETSEPLWKYKPSNSILIPPPILEVIQDELQWKLCTIPATKQGMDTILQEYTSKYSETKNISAWLRDSLCILRNLKYNEPNEEQKKDLDIDYIDFFLQEYEEIHSLEKFKEKVDFITNIGELYEGNLNISEVSKAMVNFNYSLGGPIDRFQLMTNFHGKGDFYAHFHNSTEHYVTVELPYVVKDPTRKKKSKKPCHTFLIYQSGLVTQSGPDEEMMKEAYLEFMCVFEDIKDLVMKK
jgi:TATA-box binding protein (TBP) (component of TFIID and TFIIIB)